MPVDFGAARGAQSCDPRSRLVREKYFCIRPQPLERWLWSKRIPSSAERVFWLHWQEGMQRGDWCSEIPLRRVARECHLDISTVTRAYQFLAKLGCLRRTDPGRDPDNPFQQATAVTEVRLPGELLLELNRHPNRRSNTASSERESQQSRAPKALPPGLLTTIPATTTPSHRGNPPPAGEPDQATPANGTSEFHSLSHPERASEAPTPDPATDQTDPFPGLTGRKRLCAISQLLDLMSPEERRTYQDALRMHQSRMHFDTHSKLSLETRSKILHLLASLSTRARASNLTPSKSQPISITRTQTPKCLTPRKLSLFELAHLNRQLQTATSPTSAPDLLRQVVWSIEAGALRRFDTRHALHIALKKVREGAWTRPNRMPPNWARALSQLPVPESCGHA